MRYFPIETAQVTLSSSLVYDGNQHTQSIKVVCNSKTLIEGTDYEVQGTRTATDHNESGNYTLVIKGMGNYSGTKNVDWNIAQKDISGLNIEIVSAVENTGIYPYLSDVQISLKDGNSPIDIPSNQIQLSYDQITIDPSTGKYRGVVSVIANGRNYTGYLFQVVTYDVHIPDLSSWEEGNWSWKLNKGVLTIFGQGNMPNFEYEGTPWESEKEQITSIVIEEGITGIGSHSFDYCHKLKQVSLPSTLIYIGENAFFDDYGNAFTSIDLPNGLNYIYSDAFSRAWNIECINLPASVIGIVGTPFFCIHHIAVAENNPCFTVTDGVLFTKNMKKLIYYPTKIENEFYAIPNGVEVIGDYAFSDQDYLTSLTIPEGVKEVGSCAFMYCYDLKTVRIPSSISDIGGSAFSGCSGLKDVYYSGTQAQWKGLISGIGCDDEFNNCTIHYGK